MEKITYRNWDNCYRISNGTNTVIINAAAGGRVMAFERNGINIIYEDPRQDGLLLDDYLLNGFDPDGGRFDYGQEAITRDLHSITYMGQWSGRIINDYSLEIISATDLGLGLLSTRIFSLNPETSVLSITQKMKNVSDSPCSYFFWGRTLVRIGGLLFMPLNPDSMIPGKWGRYIWEEPERFENDPDDLGVSVKGDVFILDPVKARSAKYGNDSHAGWMAYVYKPLLFIKKYGYFSGAVYTEKYGQTNIFYTNGVNFAEMEPISPAAFLEPGEEYSYREEWYLLDYQSESVHEFNFIEAVRFAETHFG